MGEAAGHYFDDDPSAASRPSSVRLDLPDRSFTFTTDRGVFSADRVDPGTKYLLLEGPGSTGDGYVRRSRLRVRRHRLHTSARAPGATVWAIEVNQRARALCAANAETASLANVRVAAPDDFPGDLSVDLLWSNPPIRIGKEALHDLLQTWLGRLSPEGRALLVVQKHLGADSLQRWLDNEGWAVARMGPRTGYRLLEVGR